MDTIYALAIGEREVLLMGNITRIGVKAFCGHYIDALEPYPPHLPPYSGRGPGGRSAQQLHKQSQSRCHRPWSPKRCAIGLRMALKCGALPEHPAKAQVRGGG